jgi:hypothetical protein
MRPFVHWTLAGTACFAVTAVFLAATDLFRGQLDSRWQSAPGAVQGIAQLIVVSVIGGSAIAGIASFFDWLGWDRQAITDPIVRAALFANFGIWRCASVVDSWNSLASALGDNVPLKCAVANVRLATDFGRLRKCRWVASWPISRKQGNFHSSPRDTCHREDPQA